MRRTRKLKRGGAKVCPACTFENPDGATVCEICGTRLDSKKRPAEDPSSASSSAARVDESSEGSPDERRSPNACDACTFENPDGASTCRACSAPLKYRPVWKKGVGCSRCGRVTARGADCQHCNTPLPTDVIRCGDPKCKVLTSRRKEVCAGCGTGLPFDNPLPVVDEGYRQRIWGESREQSPRNGFQYRNNSCWVDSLIFVMFGMTRTFDYLGNQSQYPNLAKIIEEFRNPTSPTSFQGDTRDKFRTRELPEAIRSSGEGAQAEWRSVGGQQDAAEYLEVILGMNAHPVYENSVVRWWPDGRVQGLSKFPILVTSDEKVDLRNYTILTNGFFLRIGVKNVFNPLYVLQDHAGEDFVLKAGITHSGSAAGGHYRVVFYEAPSLYFEQRGEYPLAYIYDDFTNPPLVKRPKVEDLKTALNNVTVWYYEYRPKDRGRGGARTKRARRGNSTFEAW